MRPIIKSNSEPVDIASNDVNDIAIIGLALKLPFANNISEFWNNLIIEKDCITSIPKSRKELVDNIVKLFYPSKVAYRDMAYIDNIDMFDYIFFGLSHKEAALMDPCQRLFLETTWNAIEDAGYGGDCLKGSSTGVYVGYGNETEYKRFINIFEPDYMTTALSGNLSAMIPSRISYFLDLKGPSMLINTACSSGLVALHLACQGLRNGDCNMAIVGGVRVILMPVYKDEKTGIHSPDGKTRTFDDKANGTGTGEGVISIILKPLNRAVEDNDNIYAVIKGSAINQDGNSVSITAPNPIAQKNVIINAWQNAGIDPTTVSYIEAHGTGTKLGDPIEVEGITRAFRRYTNKRQFCAIGALKTNIGHLDSVAGLAGLVKVVLSLKNQLLPATLHFENPNRNIDFINSPIYVNDILREWNKTEIPRRGGVSAFGLSGTNCHVVLQEAPNFYNNVHNPRDKEHNQIFTLSAKSKNSFLQIVKKYLEYLDEDNLDTIDSICYTANTGRGLYNYRIAFIVKNKKELKIKLKNIYEALCSHVESDDFDDILNLFVGDYNTELKDNSIKKIIKKYLSGEKPNWNDIYKDQSIRKASIPTYQYDKIRCWIKNHVEEKDWNKIIFKRDWREVEIKDNIDSIIGDILVISNNMYGENIIEKIKEYNLNVIKVTMREEISELKNIDITNVTHVLHLSTISDVKVENMKQLEYAISEIYGIIRFMQIFNIKQSVKLILISSFVNCIKKGEIAKPENAILFGIGKTIHYTFRNILCRCIDVDFETDQDKIICEILLPSNNYMTVFRKNKKYVEEITNFGKRNREDGLDSFEIRNRGVYIVTGGTGKIGIQICEYLSLKQRIHLVILNRSKLINEMVQERLKFIQNNGTSVEIINVDLMNEISITNAINIIRNKYGYINGIIHCAAYGVGKKGIEIKDLSLRKFILSVGAKVYGTFILDYLTRYDKLDFFILFSSAITIMGGKASSAYVAANSYLDAFKSCVKDRKIISIDWPTWMDTVDGTINESEQIFMPISNDLGIQIFEYILNRKIDNCIVGEINSKYKVLCNSKSELLPFSFSDNIKCDLNETNNEKIVNQRLRGSADNAYTEAEKVLAYVIGENLDLENIDINDNFYDLGGNSLILIKVELDLEKLGVVIYDTGIFRTMTIKQIAKTLNINKKNRKLIPYNDLYYRSCFYNDLFTILNYYNGNISAFLVNDIENYTLNRNNFVKVKYFENKKIETILGDFNIKCSFGLWEENVSNKIKSAINSNKFVIIWVDPYFASIRKDVYLKKHISHTWLIYDYDIGNNRFSIIEHSNSDSLNYKECLIDEAELENAYKGFCERYEKDVYGFSYYEFFKNVNEPVEAKNYREIYLHNILIYAEEIKSGIDELKIFSQKYKKLLRDSTLFLDDLDEIINSLNKIINTKKIEDYRLVHLFPEAGFCIEENRNIMSKWNNLRNLLVKMKITKKAGKQFEKTGAILMDIVSLEERYFMQKMETLVNRRK